jgi:hypothetical protein
MNTTLDNLDIFFKALGLTLLFVYAGKSEPLFPAWVTTFVQSTVGKFLMWFGLGRVLSGDYRIGLAVATVLLLTEQTYGRAAGIIPLEDPDPDEKESLDLSGEDLVKMPTDREFEDLAKRNGLEGQDADEDHGSPDLNDTRLKP